MATFSLRGRFFVMFGSRPGPKLSPKVVNTLKEVSTFSPHKRALAPEVCLETLWEAPGVVLEAFGEPLGWILDEFSMLFRDGSRAKILQKILSGTLGETPPAGKSSAKPLHNS